MHLINFQYKTSDFFRHCSSCIGKMQFLGAIFGFIYPLVQPTVYTYVGSSKNEIAFYVLYCYVINFPTQNERFFSEIALFALKKRNRLTGFHTLHPCKLPLRKGKIFAMKKEQRFLCIWRVINREGQIYNAIWAMSHFLHLAKNFSAQKPLYSSNVEQIRENLPVYVFKVNFKP